MKNLSILGSTGSIGRNTLEVVRNLNKNGYNIKVKYLSANSNFELLAEQIDEFKPNAAVIYDHRYFNDFEQVNRYNKCELLHGKDGLYELIRRNDYDIAVNALVGFVGLIPTIEAIRHGKDVALANKESLVVAGELINNLIEHSKSRLFPIDSEHSAIQQCLLGESRNRITKLTLTASGGPFLNYSKDLFENVTTEEALQHPNWKMGNKITIDSATLMNKGFEIIEAKWLFGIEAENIEVLIHPQSIIHSLVEFVDGSVKAQLGMPDMKIPIQYALTYPDRICSDFPRLDLSLLKTLSFGNPDFEKFECLKLAYEVIKLGRSYPVVLNAANEVAVDMFLNHRIKFNEIPVMIKRTLEKHQDHSLLDIDSIVETDRESREITKKMKLN